MLKGNARLVFMVITIHDGTLPHIPKMGYRFVAPVSGCADSSKVVGRSATLPVFSNLDLAREAVGFIS
jgi:hypothetical protein